MTENNSISWKIKNGTSFIIRISGLHYLINKFFCNKRATIIHYHAPEPDIFSLHMEYLSRHYKFITLNLLVDAIHKKDWSGIPPRSIIVTMDDGHINNYRILECFRKYGVKPTIYVCSGIVNTNRSFWWMKVDDVILCQKLKKLSNSKFLMYIEDNFDYNRVKEYPERVALNLYEMKEMMPYTDFGSHSRYHAILPKCTDGECMDETGGSKRELEEILGRPCLNFSFPNGDYTDRDIDFLKKTGYLSARTNEPGWNSIDSDPFRLKSMYIGENDSINILVAKLCRLQILVRDKKGPDEKSSIALKVMRKTARRLVRGSVRQ